MQGGADVKVDAVTKYPFKKCKRCGEYFPNMTLPRHMKKMHRGIIKLEKSGSKIVRIPISDAVRKELELLRSNDCRTYTEIIRSLLKHREMELERKKEAMSTW
jgi:hypothetical protein